MAEGANELRLITFRVGTETFVLDIMAVRQIVPYSGSTFVPTAPAFIEGIVVLRNEVIPIVDLRDRLYPTLGGRAEEPLVLITLTSAGVIGFKVDEVRRIVTVSTEAFLPPPPIIRGIRGELLIAVVPYGEEVYLLVDVENILSGSEKQELRDADLRLETANDGR
ncbi:MAG TPA: chemotaxis protein CheW [Thermoanaerobaculia bacterium]|nr:chemotaxis protein CheW [Thermoanaerobaculia bacterium]